MRARSCLSGDAPWRLVLFVRRMSVVRRSLLATRLACAAALTLCSAAAARDDGAPDRVTPLALDANVHEHGAVRTLITNWGQVGSKPGTPSPFASAPSAQWPGQSGIEYLWIGGFWFGALQSGVPHVTTAAYAVELSPGAAVDDRIYTTYAGAPGGNRAPAPADDDADGSFDEDWLDGRDNDGDTRVDEDFAAIADEMFVATYADTDAILVTAQPEHVPLGLAVRQTTLAWSRPEIDDFIGFDLHLANVDTTTLTDPHIGFFADCDIGPREGVSTSSDDRAGFWEGTVTTTLEGDTRDVPVSIAYMFDADHDGGASPGYIGFVFLDAAGITAPVRLRNFRMFSGSASYAFGGDPTNDTERFACLDGTSPVSLPPPGPTPRASVLAPRDSDWRILASIGPLPTLAPGGTLDVAMAMVLGGSLDDMLQNAAHAQMLYDGVVADCDGVPATPEECVVHWTTPRTVPVDLVQLDAWRAGDAVQLAWQLSPAAMRTLLALRPLRGTSERGTFQACAGQPLSPTATDFVDPAAPEGALWYQLELVNRDGTARLSRPVRVDAMPPREARLEPPRLDADGVSIRWRLAKDTSIRLSIHDVNGRLVRSLHHGVSTVGVHTLEWDRTADSGVPVSRGMYLVRLEAETLVQVRKVALFVD